MITIPSALAGYLESWIKEHNPNGNEDTAEDLKHVLDKFVDDHTMSRALVERRIREHLSSYDVSFRSQRIEISEGEVKLRITGPDRCGSIILHSSEFDSSEDISRFASYAEEIENSVWDDDVGEELINKWFELEE